MDRTRSTHDAATRRTERTRRRSARRSERGASLVEYALLVALIAVVMVGAVTLLGETASTSIDESSSSIAGATG